MSAVIKEPSLYEQLIALPENLEGEIIEGVLHAQPRPSARHVSAATAMGGELYSPYQRGRGGPGGWWILAEPEVHFVRDSEILVPDLAGWRRERMPLLPKDQRFEIVPDWVCEVLSPATYKKDRVLKKKVYARYGVAFLWMVDPMERILETYALSDGQWVETGLFQDEDQASAPPFDAITIALADLWEGNAP